MSFISRLGIVVTGESGQAQAALNALSSRAEGLGRSAAQGTRQTSLWNQQWRAMGTTLRYATAGMAVFGSINMVRQMAQFGQQLGLISAIGTAGGGIPLVGRQLGDLKNQIIAASVDTITPVSSMTDAVINFLSTVQNAPRNQIVPIVSDLAQVAKLTQVNVEDATKAITTMDVAFGQANNLKNVDRMSQLWFTLIQRAPGGVAAAPQIIGQLGQLAAQSKLANINPAQMFGLLLGTLRFGIPPAMAARGLGFLLQTISVPSAQRKQTREALGSLGITDEFIQSPEGGGKKALDRIFAHARSLGLRGDLRALGRSTKALGPDANLDADTMKSLGLSGPGAAFLAQIFGRVHALRTAIALFSRADPAKGTGKNLEGDITDLSRMWNDAATAQENWKNAWKRFARQSNLSQAAQAVEALQYQVGQSLAPILNIATKPITGLAHLAGKHPDITTDITRVTAGFLAAIGIDKLFLGGKLGKGLGGILRRVPLLSRFAGGGLGRAALVAKTAEDEAKSLSGQLPDGTPGKPFYVVVLGQLLNDPAPSTGFTPITGPGALGKAESAAEKVGAATGLRSLFGRLGGWRMVGKLGAAGLFGYGLSEAQKALFGGTPDDPLLKHQVNFGRGLYYNPKSKGFMTAKPGGHGEFFNQITEPDAAKRLHVSLAAIKQLEKFAGRPDMAQLLQESNDKLVAAIEGSPGNWELNLTIVDDKGKAVAQKRVHINPNDVTFQGGKTPSSRGQAKKITKKIG